MLRVSSLYGHGFDEAHLTRLEELGFTLRPQVMTYAGSQVCHFIDFAAGPALEFIQVTDRSDYESFVPAGMRPYCPGISLVDDGDPATLDVYDRDFSDLDPYRLHVAYDDGAGSDSPGWHYLNFAVPLVRDTFIWLTAFDAPKPARTQAVGHTNGARGVVGLEFGLPASELAGLSRLTGQPFVDDRLNVAGVTVRATGDGSDVARKAFPLRSVVLRAGSLESFQAHAKGAQTTTFMGEPAIRITTNPLAWDLVITTWSLPPAQRVEPGPAASSGLEGAEASSRRSISSRMTSGP